jgi:predicted Zn-dependent peptidase
MIEVFTLKNGIRVLFDKTNGRDIVSLRVLTPVSVINETLINAGISNLTSKLMIYSTKKRSNEMLTEDVGNIGAHLSFDLSHDMAGVGISCLCEYFDKASEILSDVVLNPIFDNKEFTFEKEHSIAVLNFRKDSISATALDVFVKLLYGDTPYSFPAVGNKDSILKSSCEDLMKWHEYSYNASNILISIAGNINGKIVRDSLERYFSSLGLGDQFEAPSFNISHKGDIKKVIKGKFNQAYILIGFPAPDVKNMGFVAANVLEAILGDRMTSVLFIELREKLGLAYEVDAIYPSRRKESYFAVYIGLDKNNINLTLKKIDEILKEFCSVRISDQELRNVKAYIKGAYLLGRQTVNRRSLYNGWREIIGQGYKYDLEYLNDVEKITTQDVLDIANKIFTEKSISVIINPEE